MSISILHLSDIHFKKKNNNIFERQEQLFNSIKNELEDGVTLIIVVTGDIAFSGSIEEYKQAKLLLDYICDSVQKYHNNITVRYVFTPGNHDCNFSKDSGTRKLWQKEIISKPDLIDDESIAICTSIQQEYFDFINSLDGVKESLSNISNNLFNRYEFKIDNFTIAFNSFNTAWLSKIDENQAEIIFPLNKIMVDDISSLGADFTISLHHHPLHWLQHTNIRELESFINKTSDIVLTGHEHSVSATIKDNMYSNEEYILHIEGATLQDSYDINTSVFNFINLKDITSPDNIVFAWNGTIYEKSIEKKLELTIHEKTLFTFDKLYKDKILKPDIKIMHPRKENITIQDLYVYPNLEEVLERKSLVPISASNLKSFDKHNRIIYGADNSGKSAFTRIMQLNYKQDGYLPIIISGHNIIDKKNLEFMLDKLIKKAFLIQYTNNKEKISQFEQLDKEEIIIIIDDFENAKMNNSCSSDFINILLKKGYRGINIFASETIKLEATSESLLAKSLKDFEHFHILPFGHTLRDDLVKKWIRLEQEGEIEISELLQISREYSNIIDQTIGLNLVPSFPVILLTLLQSIEYNDTNSIEKSSYGNYYNYLILKYINTESILTPKEQNIMFSYISSLAYKMCISMTHEYSESEIQEFDYEHKKLKQITPTFNLLDRTVKSNILIKSDENYKFSQKYIYYYFVAHYLAHNIDKKEISEVINKMIERLYRTEFANIIMFVLHLSTKTEIINKLEIETTKIFSSLKEFSFEKNELKNINSLIKKDTLNILEKKSIEEERKKELEEKESKLLVEKRSYIDDKYDADINEDIKTLDFFSQINLGNKLIEITGEIVKNYAGTIDGDVSERLIRSNYGLGLRIIQNVIGLFEKEHKLLIEIITDLIIKRGLITEDKINEAVTNIIFGISTSYSYDIIKKIARAVGTKELKGIYNRISKNSKNPITNKENIAYNLIQLAIDLDFKGGLNKSKIIAMHRDLSIDGNGLTDSVLKKLVLQHLYMFEIDYNKRSSICAKLDIGEDSSKKEQMKQLKQ